MLAGLSLRPYYLPMRQMPWRVKTLPAPYKRALRPAPYFLSQFKVLNILLLLYVINKTEQAAPAHL